MKLSMLWRRLSGWTLLSTVWKTTPVTRCLTRRLPQAQPMSTHENLVLCATPLVAENATTTARLCPATSGLSTRVWLILAWSAVKKSLHLPAGLVTINVNTLSDPNHPILWVMPYTPDGPNFAFHRFHFPFQLCVVPVVIFKLILKTSFKTVISLCKYLLFGDYRINQNLYFPSQDPMYMGVIWLVFIMISHLLL